MTEAKRRLAKCEAGRIALASVPAEVEIMGVAFCGPCARRQVAYFAIGELTDEEEARDLRAARWSRHWRESGELAREVRISVWMQMQ